MDKKKLSKELMSLYSIKEKISQSKAIIENASIAIIHDTRIPSGPALGLVLSDKIKALMLSEINEAEKSLDGDIAKIQNELFK